MPLRHFPSDPLAYSVLYQAECGEIVHVDNHNRDAFQDHKKNCPKCNLKKIRKQKLMKLNVIR